MNIKVKHTRIASTNAYWWISPFLVNMTPVYLHNYKCFLKLWFTFRYLRFLGVNSLDPSRVQFLLTHAKLYKKERSLFMTMIPVSKTTSYF